MKSGMVASREPRPRRGGAAWLAALVALAALAGLGCRAPAPSAARAPASSEFHILPGRETAVMGMVQAAAQGQAVRGISIDHDVVRVALADGTALIVARRGGAAGPGTAADGVTLQCAGPCEPAQVARAAPFAARLARARAERADAIWTYAPPPPPRVHQSHLEPSGVQPSPGRPSGVQPSPGRPSGGRQPVPTSWQLPLLPTRWIVWRGLFVALVAASAWQAATPRRDRRWLAWALPVLAAGALTLLLARVPLLPAHDHNTFIARADCAIDPLCETSPRGAWGMPSLTVYGLFLAALPYRLLTLSALSLGLAAVSAVLLVALVRAMLLRTAWADRATLTGVTAGLFLVGHPAFARVAASDTAWPFAATCLLAAGLSALRATEPDARPWEPWVALGWLGFAMTTNHVMLALAPLVALAPLALATRPFRLRAAYLVGLAGWAAMVAPTARDLLAGLDHPIFARAMARLLYLDPRLTPPTWALLWAVGLAAVAFLRARVFVVVLYAWAATQLPLAAQVELQFGYPTRFVHAFLSHYFDATFAAVGVAAAVGWLRDRRALGLALAVVAAAALLPWPRSRETLSFARERRPLSLEARALSAALDRLPPHDVLVIPPAIEASLRCARLDTDPVEATFPVGELTYVFRRRGLPVPRVMTLGAYLAAPPAPGAATLFYLGSVYRTFLPCEIRERLVPPSLERPSLAGVRARFALTPVATFVVPTAQHRFAAMRVLADRAPAVTLGFYRLAPRP